MRVKAATNAAAALQSANRASERVQLDEKRREDEQRRYGEREREPVELEHLCSRPRERHLQGERPERDPRQAARSAGDEGERERHCDADRSDHPGSSTTTSRPMSALDAPYVPPSTASTRSPPASANVPAAAPASASDNHDVATTWRTACAGARPDREGGTEVTIPGIPR